MEKAIVIMSRVPNPGYTKTRLMPRLTGQQCAQLHLACLQDIGQVVSKMAVTPYLYYTGGPPDCFYWLEEAGFKLRQQEGPDLGARLYHATGELLQQHQQLLLLGADLPDLSTQLLESAFQHLGHSDVVLGPARDGGYYLLGLKAPHQELFAEIPWGTATVYADTLQALQQAGLSYRRLKVKQDLDTWEDLVDFYQGVSQKPQLRKLATWQLLTELLAGS